MNDRRSFPYLDTIETAQNNKVSPDSYSINSSDGFFSSQRYEELHKNDNSDTIKSFEYYKHLTDDLAGLLVYEDSILQERAEQMFDCGTFLEFADDKLLNANFCRQRICPNCQRRRALKTCVDTLAMQKELQKNNYKYLHIVLTVPNCSADELDNVINKLYTSSSAMFRSKDLKKKFKGVMRCLEITYNSKYRLHTQDDVILGNCFHPHLHCLIAVGKSYGSGKNYISQARLSALWMLHYGTTDFLNVYIASLKNGDEKAVSEIAKYCVKPLELNCPPTERRLVTEILFSVLHGRRLVQLYGCFRDVARLLKIDVGEFKDEVKSIPPENIRRYSYNRVSRKYDLTK